MLLSPPTTSHPYSPLFPPADGKCFFTTFEYLGYPPFSHKSAIDCSLFWKLNGRQSKACFLIEIHQIKILPFFNKLEPGPNVKITVSAHFLSTISTTRPHSVSIAVSWYYYRIIFTEKGSLNLRCDHSQTIATLGKHKLNTRILYLIPVQSLKNRSPCAI